MLSLERIQDKAIQLLSEIPELDKSRDCEIICV